MILMHDIYQASVEAAVRIVDALEEKGFCVRDRGAADGPPGYRPGGGGPVSSAAMKKSPADRPGKKE